MSIFSGLNGALTSLIAQSRALDTAGNNIANVNTPGYTRQRANLQSIEGAAAPSLHAIPGAAANGGVRVASIDRLGDLFLEARVRQESAASSCISAVSEVMSLLESTVAEPGENGLGAQLDTFFTSWADLANVPDSGAARAVLLESAHVLVDAIGAGYRAVESQWAAARGRAGAVAEEVNAIADSVADLNARIRSINTAGGSPNALVDQRQQHLVSLACLVGGEARPRPDGSVDVMLAGNALVRGEAVHHVRLSGPTALAGLDAAPLGLTWTESGNAVGAIAGELRGLVSVLGPAGTPEVPGDALADLAARYDALATTLATSVNDLHTGAAPAGATQAPPASPPFFTLPADPRVPAALGLGVGVGVGQIVTGGSGLGPLDSSIADAISQLTTARDAWSRTVVDLGVNTRRASQRADNAQSNLDVATNALLARTGVNLDEETVALMASQRAYEAAARVITTIDQMLDVLINRTGVVGR